MNGKVWHKTISNMLLCSDREFILIEGIYILPNLTSVIQKKNVSIYFKYEGKRIFFKYNIIE